MEGFRFTPGIEPVDKYEKAKQDVLQALCSVRELPPEQQQMLAEEFVGAANVAAMISILQQYFR